VGEREYVGHPTSDCLKSGHHTRVALDAGADGERELAARPQLRAPGGLPDGGDKGRIGELGIEDAAAVSADELAVGRDGPDDERLERDRRLQPQSLDQRSDPH